MLHYELSWQQAAVASACLTCSAVALRLARRPARAWPGTGAPAGGRPATLGSPSVPSSQAAAPARRRAVAAFAQEAGTLLGLFALWQLAGSHSVLGPGSALARASWLWHAERVLHMPSEAAVQRAFLPHPLVIQAFNLYYAGLHFAVLLGCLLWLFIRHRASYARVRTTVVLFTALSLLVQLIPVAPPRMLPGDGMIDTAVRYGQSVYGSDAGFNPDQLSAMPSVHIGWALLVAVVIICVSGSRWRWLAVCYPALTTLAVVVTANHFWLDGAAAAVLLALALVIQRAGQAAVRRHRRRRRGPAASPAAPWADAVPSGQPSAAAAARAAAGSAAAMRSSAAESCAADRNHAS